MNTILSRWRPLLVLAAILLVLMLLDFRGMFSTATGYSALQHFSSLSLVALGLGLTILIGEFDLSVAGVFGLAGCIAVIIGNDNATMGLLAALAAGAVFGATQGVLIARLGLGSVPVTLGGLLFATGIAYVITQNRSLSFDNIALALALNERILGIFSIRSLVAIAIFVLAAIIFWVTRLGRDLVAVGSDRRAAIVTGLPVQGIIVGSFAMSSLLASLAGALLSFGLASAAPTGLTDIFVPAIAATILGGMSLAGGVGTPLGIACGVLTLTILRAGLNMLAAPPFAHDLAIGLVLLGVGIMDGPYLMRRLHAMRTALGS